MTQKHTPGPWHVSQRATDTPDNPGQEMHAVVSDERLANVATIGLRGTAAVDNANAALIAAAPDLLAALVAFRDGGPQGGQDFAEWHQSYAPAIALARAAIAKATAQ